MVKQTYTIRKVNSEREFSPYEFVITRETDTGLEPERDVIKHLNDLLDFAFEDRANRLKREDERIMQDLVKKRG